MTCVSGSLKSRLSEIEKEEILNALRECGWIMAKAARRLGMTERMIGYKVKKYGIRKKEVSWMSGEEDEKMAQEQELSGNLI